MADTDKKEKQTFLEIQDKIIDAHARSKALAHQQRVKERSLHVFGLVREQLEPLPETTKVYRCVGRGYFLHPKGNILAQLETEGDQCKGDIEQLNTAQQVVESDLKESEQQMREFLMNSPASIAKLNPA